MNGFVKSLVAFVAGTIVGGVVAYIYADKKKAEEFEQELEAYKKEYEQTRVETTLESTNDNEEEPLPEIPEDVLNNVKEMQAGIRKTRVNYNKIIDESEYDTMEETKPYLVDADIYFTDAKMYADYDRIELYFNPEDYELFTADGELIEDPEELVGMKNLSDLVERVATELYICNPDKETLYNVCIEEN